VCETPSASAQIFMEKNVDPRNLSAASYASRKEPEFMCHRLVRCETCDLVYVDQPPSASTLATAYHDASYDSEDEAADAAEIYFQSMRSTLMRLRQREDALEIGAGSGAFLKQLADSGFTRVTGIEPSVAAISAAPAAVRPWLRQGIFIEADYPPASFDLICCFMTLEHVPDPKIIASACCALLRPGGVFVTVTHDYRSVVNRILGRRSPIIDIEHMQLFSGRSIRELFERTGFSNVTVAPFANRYALKYWLRLTPLPRALKQSVAALLAALGLDRKKLAVNVGNVIATGIKPG
jgi:SAM-dependent methyltransferase